MVRKKTTFTFFILLLLFLGSIRLNSFSVKSIGAADVEVTAVYWGSNPLLPESAHPGDVNVVLSLVLTNVGDDVARGVNATLILEAPLKYTFYLYQDKVSASSVSKFAGDIYPGSSFTLTYTLNVDANADQGNYRYPLEISYRSARELHRINKEVTIDIPIWKGDLKIQNIQTNPIKIFPGDKQVQIKIFIVNSGKGSIKDVHIRLELTQPFRASSSDSDNIFLGTIAPGQVSEANFIIDVDDEAECCQYPIILINESSSIKIPIGEVPLYINEKVRFKIVNITPVEFKPGDTGIVVRIELKNIGTIESDSVRVQLRVGNFFSGTLTDFLGTMLPGEVKVAFFTIDIDSKASIGNYNFDLRIDWTQDEYSLNETLSVPFNLSSQGSSPIPYIIGLLALIIIIVIIVIRRRKK